MLSRQITFLGVPHPAKLFVPIGLPPLVVSCRSFSGPNRLFSVTYSLFCQNRGGVGTPLSLGTLRNVKLSSPLTPLLPITSLQPQQFQAITHSFAQRRPAIPCILSGFRTLCVATGGLPLSAGFKSSGVHKIFRLDRRYSFPCAGRKTGRQAKQLPRRPPKPPSRFPAAAHVR